MAKKMDINELAQKHILNQPLYVTGKPIAYTAREFGLDPKDIDKLASNENPFGPSPKGMAEARKALEEIFSTLDEDSSSSSAESEVVHAAKKNATKPARKIFMGAFFIR